MRWSVLRGVAAVFAVLTFAACSRPQTDALPLPDVSVSLMRSAVKAHAVAFKFRIRNEGPDSIEQKIVGTPYCMVRVPAGTRIDPNQQLDVDVEVDQKGSCQFASFIDGYRVAGTPADRRAEFTFEFARAGSGFGSNSAGASARGWNGLCGHAVKGASQNFTIRIFQGQPPTQGCFKTGAMAIPHAGRSFDFKIENATGIELSAFTKSSYCIGNVPFGAIGAGVTQPYKFATLVGSWCNYAADFTTELTAKINGQKTLVGGLFWGWQDPGKFTIVPEGRSGYCGQKLSDTHVRFYKVNAQGGC